MTEERYFLSYLNQITRANVVLRGVGSETTVSFNGSRTLGQFESYLLNGEVMTCMLLCSLKKQCQQSLLYYIV